VKAHAHGLTGTTAWLGGCLVAGAVGHRPATVAVIGGAAVATGMAIAPDLDVQGTAARALGWPTRVLAWAISWLTEHRGVTHWVASGAVLALAVSLTATARWTVQGVTGPWAAVVILTLGYAWAEAAAVADDNPGSRIGAVGLWLLSLAAALLTLHFDRHLDWLGPAVLAGWWAHLLGDMCTSDRWPALAPFTFREFGGWRLIRPTPRGRRVTRTERLIESLLFGACCVTGAGLAGWWPPLMAAVVAARH
jgi:membrane-bound metal-dependent hydrolase YbcI (DUF457 family)